MTVTKVEALSGNDSLAIMSGADAASAMLGLNNYEESDVVQEAIERFLNDLAAGKAQNTLGPMKGPFALGSLWGNTLLMTYEWTWIKVLHNDGQDLGVVDRERQYLAVPYQMFKKLLSDPSDPAMVRPYARFQTIGAKSLPAAEPGSLTIITG